jgi:2-amino-4-hydroxy-6-hydroxymethyldihydropteridine diphosphokinase
MVEPAFLLLGSNREPERHLRQAIAGLRELGRIERTSQVYQSPAFARPEQPDYLNAAVLIQTELDPFALRESLRKLEAELGRVRGPDKYAARTIDLDLCLLGSRIVSGEMELPDPHLLDWAHVAVPVAELDPDFLHPVTGEPLAEIATRLAQGAGLKARPEISLGAEIA